MSTRQTANYISLSDLMTGLMLIFMMIAVVTISHVSKRTQQSKDALTEYYQIRQELYQDLEKTFGQKKEEWGIAIDTDLTIRFENPSVLFGQDSADISPIFMDILQEFTPKYLAIVNKERYADKIKEVRIEGHTASYTPATPDYINTVRLSQDRARSVLSFILANPSFTSLSLRERERLVFLFTANGFGNGRMLDSSGTYVLESRAGASEKSRRVEFRIVTSSDELVDEINSQLK